MGQNEFHEGSSGETHERWFQKEGKHEMLTRLRLKKIMTFRKKKFYRLTTACFSFAGMHQLIIVASEIINTFITEDSLLWRGKCITLEGFFLFLSFLFYNYKIFFNVK